MTIIFFSYSLKIVIFAINKYLSFIISFPHKNFPGEFVFDFLSSMQDFIEAATFSLTKIRFLRNTVIALLTRLELVPTFLHRLDIYLDYAAEHYLNDSITLFDMCTVNFIYFKFLCFFSAVSSLLFHVYTCTTVLFSVNGQAAI